MDIVVHGTKGGCEIFTPKKMSGLFDAGLGEGVAALGQQAYAISFKDNNIIFSKYEIIKDVRGDKRTGFVAYSLFLPNNKKLSGIDIKTLLDKVSGEYRQRYIVDNNLNDVREDWSFLDSISNEYDAKLHAVSSYIENPQSGSKEAAFVYYPYINKSSLQNNENTFDLEDIFDSPSQEEYFDYKQVIFVKEELRNKIENPLNALRNSGVEIANIDLDNSYYYLNNYNRNKGVIITANGKIRSEGKNNNFIRAKWQVEIKYSKDEQCYFPIEAKGTLSKVDSEIFKYLEIKDRNVIINYDAFNDPYPKAKTVFLEVKDHKGDPANDAEITCINSYSNGFKNISNKEIKFEGDELKVRWSVSARKGNDLIAKPVHFIPIDCNASIQINLQETQYDSINQWGNTNKEKKYYLKIDEKFGKRSNNGRTIGEYQYNYPQFGCDPRFGYKFTKWEPYQAMAYKGCDGYYEAIFKELWFHKIPKWAWIAGCISLTLMAALILTLVPFSSDNLKSLKLTSDQISNYIEGDTLFLNRLESYKVDWEKQKPEVSNEDGGILGIFSNKGEQTDSAKYKEWDEISHSIDIAITKRKLIKEANFIELNNLSYYPLQKNFKTAIEKIISIKNEDVRNQIGDVSNLPLNQIANSINAFLTRIDSVQAEKLKNKGDVERGISQNETVLAKHSENSNQKQKVGTDIRSEITDYLRGSELKKEKLESYKSQTQNPNLKKSIDLALKFWKLDNKLNNSYASFKKELENDNILKESALNNLVTSLCSKFKPKYPKDLPDQDKKSLIQIKNKLQ